MCYINNVTYLHTLRNTNIFVSSSNSGTKNKLFTTMEGNYLTSGDLALFSEAKYGKSSGYDGYCYGHRRDGMAATGIGLAAGLGGAALLGVIAVGWGINQASKSRLRAAENAAAGNQKAIDILAQTALCERQSRESWQNYHAPTITQYTDVRTGAGAFSGAGANAAATAEALALNALVNGNNGRSGQVCPQPVALYQPAMPCRCNTCGD